MNANPDMVNVKYQCKADGKYDVPKGKKIGLVLFLKAPQGQGSCYWLIAVFDKNVDLIFGNYIVFS